MYMKKRRQFILVFSLVLISCYPLSLDMVRAEAGDSLDFLTDEFYEENGEVIQAPDPYENFNRAMFTFNDRFYFWVVDPVATGYSYVVPADLRGCVGAFFSNIEEPIRFLNTLLQGRLRDSGRIASRFLITTPLGVYGMADVAAQEFDLPPVAATLGETLGVWGVGDGFYLVVPFMGPSTLRDFSGTVIDSFGTSPYWCWANYECTRDWPTMMTIYTGRKVNSVALELGEYEKLKELTLDPYVAFRNAYFQQRIQIRGTGIDWDTEE